ncbi:uncharacterized protein FOMMEDRAFT_146527 [Fomitiporia mediterranea MF3/22]|uniref:uncharacterized protein n=1 Tax=Fomitiporia mediterranea (strain MF3/22) TaxID=694068 RepID=UPI00044087F4|nr:uncharacterized protein FOMMEDRAFT_146527 [Fomitiporia mediterranea MF3/22]EJD02620.1 hypothetical protein FOMMEDRAFT_146527 [Fomitiporia mediterranea MF3/22]
MAPRQRRCMRSVMASVVVVTALGKAGRADQRVACNNVTSWMDNASGESPCTVAYFLMLHCTTGQDLSILPLNNSARSYTNPLRGQWCSCNTVVYNLMSACAVCQGGFPTNFSTWTDDCAGVMHDYPNKELALSYSIPQWAYVNLTRRATFDLEAAEKVAGVKRGWSPIQIVLPVIIGIVVALLAVLAFLIYRRRLKQRYTQIADAYPNTPMYHQHHHRQQPSHSHSQTYSHHNNVNMTSRHGHQPTASSSTLGLHSMSGRDSPSLGNGIPRRKSAAAVAWERARLQAPRKLGGLLADRRKVHTRTRGADWSIDADNINEIGVEENGYNDPWNPQASHSRLPSGSTSHTKEVSGESTGQAKIETGNATGARLVRPSGHGRSESRLGLLSNTSPERLHPIQDSRESEGSASSFVRGIMETLNDIGMRLSGRPRPVAVVSSPPRRGFNMDDVDSAKSPSDLANPREERRSDSYVFVDGEEDEGEEGEELGKPVLVDSDTRPSSNFAVFGSSSATLNPSQGGSSGSGTRSDSSGGASASRTRAALGSRSASMERESHVDGGSERGGERDKVMLISRSPGQDFNSVEMISPITEETSGYGTGAFTTSHESENWPAALTDTSSVLLPSFRRVERSDLLPPAPPPTQQSYTLYTTSLSPSPSHSQLQSYSDSRSPTPSHSAQGTPRSPSRLLREPSNNNINLSNEVDNSQSQTQPVVPPSLRAAGGFQANSTHLNTSTMLAPTTDSISPNSAILPNSRLFDSAPEPPPSAITNTGHGTGFGSELTHSSSDAYTVPNPFTFDSRHGGSSSAANALRLASPRPESRARSSAEVIE